MTALTMIRPGQKAQIVAVGAGRGLCRRLANMGFYPGTVIEMVSNVGRGQVIVAKGGIRLGLGFGMASKILVKALTEKGGDNR